MVAVYAGLGYAQVTLPLATVSERVRFVRARIGKRDGCYRRGAASRCGTISRGRANAQPRGRLGHEPRWKTGKMIMGGEPEEGMVQATRTANSKPCTQQAR